MTFGRFGNDSVSGGWLKEHVLSIFDENLHDIFLKLKTIIDN